MFEFHPKEPTIFVIILSLFLFALEFKIIY